MTIWPLNECWAERKLARCSVDPVTLTTLAIAGAAGAAGTALASGGGGGPAPQPTAPPPMAAPQQTPQGKTLPPPQAPTFLGAAATPPVQSGSKTLLGQ